MPSWTRQASRAVDITQHHFDVGLSFPGEARGLVEQVARELEAYFYDNNYVSQLVQVERLVLGEPARAVRSAIAAEQKQRLGLVTRIWRPAGSADPYRFDSSRSPSTPHLERWNRYFSACMMVPDSSLVGTLLPR